MSEEDVTIFHYPKIVLVWEINDADCTSSSPTVPPNATIRHHLFHISADHFICRQMHSTNMHIDAFSQIITQLTRNCTKFAAIAIELLCVVAWMGHTSKQAYEKCVWPSFDIAPSLQLGDNAALWRQLRAWSPGQRLIKTEYTRKTTNGDIHESDGQETRIISFRFDSNEFAYQSDCNWAASVRPCRVYSDALKSACVTEHSFSNSLCVAKGPKQGHWSKLRLKFNVLFILRKNQLFVAWLECYDNFPSKIDSIRGNSGR